MGERKHNHEKRTGGDPLFSISHCIKRQLIIEQTETITFSCTARGEKAIKSIAYKDFVG
jgi:hypothetical protein